MNGLVKDGLLHLVKAKGEISIKEKRKKKKMNFLKKLKTQIYLERF